MSHTVYAYPKPADNGLILTQHSPWAVREDKDGNPTNLVRLTDAITERLAKAEALTWVLQDSQEAQRDGTVSNAAWAITDLIHEARELYAEQWERESKYAKLENKAQTPAAEQPPGFDRVHQRRRSSPFPA